MFRQLRRLKVVFEQHLREAVVHAVTFCLTLWIAECMVEICTHHTTTFIHHLPASQSQQQQQRDSIINFFLTDMLQLKLQLYTPPPSTLTSGQFQRFISEFTSPALHIHISQRRITR